MVLQYIGHQLTSLKLSQHRGQEFGGGNTCILTLEAGLCVEHIHDRLDGRHVGVK